MPTIKVMISEEDLMKKIKMLGKEISRDYEGEELHIICVLKGGAYFAIELSKHITVPVSIDFMSVSSYGDGTVSNGNVKIVKDLDDSVKDKNVLIVEDIIDTGRTLKYLKQLINDRGAKSLALCTLLDKPDRRIIETQIDYLGFQIPDEFVVGFGLDVGQKYRNLSYIGVVEMEEEVVE